ncbi:MFS transporter [Rhodococcus sp. NPDC056960]|uniref:MFS transporter n=1 Tax=Rhodococcus sp. NPDC056960 TaxID=3345982 RepID=UPI00363AA880
MTIENTADHTDVLDECGSRRRTRSPARAWLVAGMIIVLAMINFGDKAILGLAAVPLTKELGLSQTTYGLVASSFFLLFSIAGVAVGFLANRIPTKWLILAIALIWSISAVPLVAAASIATLFLSRIVLGASEGPTASLATHALYKWFSPEKRAIPSTLYTMGAGLGVFVSAPTLTWLISNHGWRSGFVALAIAGVLWSAVWAVVGREGPERSPETADGEPPEAAAKSTERLPYRRILLSPTWLGSASSTFGGYWCVVVSSAFVPAYLVTQRGYTPAHAAKAVSAYAIVAVILPVVVAVVAGRFHRRGHSSRVAYGVPQAVLVLIPAGLMFVLPHIGSSSVFFIVVALAFGIGYAAMPLSYLTASEVTPAHQRGAVLGILVAVQTLPGLFAPALTGWIIDAASNQGSGFTHAWTACAIVMTVCGLFALGAIRPGRDAARLGLRKATP